MKKRKQIPGSDTNAAEPSAKKRSPVPQIHNTDNLIMLASLAAEELDMTFKTVGVNATTTFKRGGSMAATSGAKGCPTDNTEAAKLNDAQRSSISKHQTPPSVVITSSSGTSEERKANQLAAEGTIPLRPEIQALQRDVPIHQLISTSLAETRSPVTSEPCIMLPLGSNFPGDVPTGHQHTSWVKELHNLSSGPRVMQPHEPRSGHATENQPQQQKMVNSVLTASPRCPDLQGRHSSKATPSLIVTAPMLYPASQQQQLPQHPVAMQIFAGHPASLHWRAHQPCPAFYCPSVAYPQELLIPAAWAPGAAKVAVICSSPFSAAVGVPSPGVYHHQLHAPIPNANPHPFLPHHPKQADQPSACAKHIARGYRTQVRAQMRLRQGSLATPSLLQARKSADGKRSTSFSCLEMKRVVASSMTPAATAARQQEQQTFTSVQPGPQQQLPETLYWHPHFHHLFLSQSSPELLFPAAWANLIICPSPSGAAISPLLFPQSPLPAAHHQLLPPLTSLLSPLVAQKQ